MEEQELARRGGRLIFIIHCNSAGNYCYLLSLSIPFVCPVPAVASLSLQTDETRREV